MLILLLSFDTGGGVRQYGQNGKISDVDHHCYVMVSVMMSGCSCSGVCVLFLCYCSRCHPVANLYWALNLLINSKFLKQSKGE